jgi:hypothetical protein
MAVLLALGASSLALAQENDFEQVPQQAVQANQAYHERNLKDFGMDNAADSEEGQARQKQADDNFDNLMLLNKATGNMFGSQIGDGAGMGGLGMRAPAAQPAAAEPYDQGGKAYRYRSLQEVTTAQDVPPPPVQAAQLAPSNPVVLPLKMFVELREKLKAIQEENEKRKAPMVVLGGSEFSGEARRGALALTMRLQVTLGQPDRWKVVPLIGDDVVLVKASVDGAAIPVSSQNGYHVWVTQRTGEAAVVLELLVPTKGPRGSIEYDFLVARTPVTTFRCRFPTAGLEPKLDAAIQSQARTEGASTLVTATLRPTTRIHLVGFKESTDGETQAAKVYAESLNLLSIDEASLELFTVIRYNILYAGAKDFSIQVPKGLKVVSADGEGAFRYATEENEQGTLIRGETAFPIRNSYEISLQLKRELAKGGEEFDAPLPRILGVERDNGWLGIEVPGKLKLEEKTRDAEQVLTSVDPRQLPGEMVTSAVSPILLAYRYHTPTAKVRLAAGRLPEKDPASASVDRIRATTQISAEGNLQTDLRITLRNRLGQSLSLTLPPGTEVLSATLDGAPLKPSWDAKKRLVLPLKKSRGRDRLRPFTLQVSLGGKIDKLGWFGHPELELPKVDLPVSSLAWVVYAPTHNDYTALKGDVEPQSLTGAGSWNKAASQNALAGAQQGIAAGYNPNLATGAAAAGAGATGAMPVRMAVEESGKRLEYGRYWIDGGQPDSKPVRVSFWYLRSWLLIPAWMLMVVLAALWLWLLTGCIRKALPAPLVPWAGSVVGLLLLWATFRLGGTLAILLAGAAGLLVVGIRVGLFKRGPGLVAEWARTLFKRFKDRPQPEKPRTPGQILGKLLLAILILVFGLVLLDLVLRFGFNIVLVALLQSADLFTMFMGMVLVLGIGGYALALLLSLFYKEEKARAR